MKSLDYEISEGVSGTWHYHLREVGEIKALCGAMVMRTSMRLGRWNKKIPDYHIPESFCSKCDELRVAS